jgi:hypothetical protein
MTQQMCCYCPYARLRRSLGCFFRVFNYFVRDPSLSAALHSRCAAIAFMLGCFFRDFYYIFSAAPQAISLPIISAANGIAIFFLS